MLLSHKQVSPADILLEELQRSRPLSVQSPAVLQFQDANNWSMQTEKSKYALRESLYQQSKALGLDKVSTRATLELVLPVNERVERKRQAQKYSAKKLDEALEAIETEKENFFQSIFEQELRLAKKRHEEESKFLTEAKEMRASLLDLADHLRKDKLLFAQEKALFSAEVEHQSRILEKLGAMRLELVEEACEANTVKVKVGQEVFELKLDAIEKKGGLLKDVFCGGYRDPRDEKGIYHLHIPHTSAAEFTFVADYYRDMLPAFISRNKQARLLPIMEYLDLDDMVEQVNSRTQWPVSGHWEVKQIKLPRSSSESSITLPPGWELFSTNHVSDRWGNYDSAVIRRQVSPRNDLNLFPQEDFFERQRIARRDQRAMVSSDSE